MRPILPDENNLSISASLRSGLTSEEYDNKRLGDHLSVLMNSNIEISGNYRDVLLAQINSLDAIFNGLASHAANIVGKKPDAVDKYLRIALKAQAQCVRAIEVLMRDDANFVVSEKQTIS